MECIRSYLRSLTITMRIIHLEGVHPRFCQISCNNERATFSEDSSSQNPWKQQAIINIRNVYMGTTTISQTTTRDMGSWFFAASGSGLGRERWILEIIGTSTSAWHLGDSLQDLNLRTLLCPWYGPARVLRANARTHPYCRCAYKLHPSVLSHYLVRIIKWIKSYTQAFTAKFISIGSHVKKYYRRNRTRLTIGHMVTGVRFFRFHQFLMLIHNEQLQTLAHATSKWTFWWLRITLLFCLLKGDVFFSRLTLFLHKFPTPPRWNKKELSRARKKV